MENLTKRFEQSTGYAILGDLVQILLDSDRVEQYEPTRVIEAVEATPDYFYERFLQSTLDRMAAELTRGFETVDAEEG